MTPISFVLQDEFRHEVLEGLICTFGLAISLGVIGSGFDVADLVYIGEGGD
jgi:hypothetical protein